MFEAKGASQKKAELAGVKRQREQSGEAKAQGRADCISVERDASRRELFGTLKQTKRETSAPKSFP